MPDKQRILIVDDISSNIKVLNELLKEQYHISVALNGSDALEIAKSENKPDLILLDIMMPEMDGYEVCKRLKANPQTLKIPVIFVTAKCAEEDESRGFDLGCVDYITKPVSPPIVLSRVKTHLLIKEIIGTMESQNKKLKAAGKLREEVERITHHDLKNPLTGVFSGIDLLEFMGNLNKDQADTVSIIKESAHKMLHMINSSLDLFKMEQNIYQPKLVDVDIIDIIHRIEKEMSGIIKLKRTRVLVNLNDRPLDPNKTYTVKGENLLLYSMMANLIKNAIEAIPENKVITISLSYEDALALICIHNQGIVPKNIQESFFEKYATAGKNRGTGIGTYSAKLIAETLDGKISMTSSKAKGTNIFIHLPSDG